MAKTIKIIDLLNKIANGEEVPKKIKILGLEFEWFEGCYRTCDTLKKYLSDCWRLDNILNDTVEIIEEQQDIDIQEIEELPKILFLGTGKNDLTKVLNDIIDNQNQQLQAVKQLDRNKKDKE